MGITMLFLQDSGFQVFKLWPAEKFYFTLELGVPKLALSHTHETNQSLTGHYMTFSMLCTLIFSTLFCFNLIYFMFLKISGHHPLNWLHDPLMRRNLQFKKCRSGEGSVSHPLGLAYLALLSASPEKSSCLWHGLQHIPKANSPVLTLSSCKSCNF